MGDRISPWPWELDNYTVMRSPVARGSIWEAYTHPSNGKLFNIESPVLRWQPPLGLVVAPQSFMGSGHLFGYIDAVLQTIEGLRHVPYANLFTRASWVIARDTYGLRTRGSLPAVELGFQDRVGYKQSVGLHFDDSGRRTSIQVFNEYVRGAYVSLPEFVAITRQRYGAEHGRFMETPGDSPIAGFCGQCSSRLQAVTAVSIPLAPTEFAPIPERATDTFYPKMTCGVCPYSEPVKGLLDVLRCPLDEDHEPRREDTKCSRGHTTRMYMREKKGSSSEYIDDRFEKLSNWLEPKDVPAYIKKRLGGDTD